MLGDISLEPLREGTREWAVPSPMEAVTSDLLVELSAQLQSENDPLMIKKQYQSGSRSGKRALCNYFFFST